MACRTISPGLSTIARGAAAETLAAEYLRLRGLTIIARNLRCKAGELDLVCIDGNILVIVEVRHRTRSDFGGALASVTADKQRKLIRATQYFWQRRPAWHARIIRFDVIALQTEPPGLTLADATIPHIEWIKDAFRVTR